MTQISTLAIDLAKHSFQVCATTSEGKVIYNRKLSRAALKKLLAQQSACCVTMEACATSHYWGRVASGYGHDVKLIAPIYVKPFVRRNKNDANDALAIATAVRQPDMRFVSVKTQEQQAKAVLFRSHQTLTRQRTQLLVTLRGHLNEFGIVVAKGNAALMKFEDRLENEEGLVPDLVLEMTRLYYHHLHELNRSLQNLTRQMEQIAKTDEVAKRIQTMPGIGPVNAAAFLAFAPPMESFKRGRDFAAWLGLVPRQHSTGGKTRLGKVSKMGQSDMRRLLITGAMGRIRWALIKGVEVNSWLGRMLAQKPRKMVAVALANKMARALWAMVTKDENYKAGHVVYMTA